MVVHKGVCDLPNYVYLVTYKYYYEIDELPNPRPTQPKKNRLQVALGPFSPTANIFPWVGIVVLYRKHSKINVTQAFLRKHPS